MAVARGQATEGTVGWREVGGPGVGGRDLRVPSQSGAPVSQEPKSNLNSSSGRP